MSLVTPLAQDHLRVCGADPPLNARRVMLKGSPPRVRSRQRRDTISVHNVGITSACAEQTLFQGRCGRHDEDHLRVCGADARSDVMFPALLGSPPRVRSRQMPSIIAASR